MEATTLPNPAAIDTARSAPPQILRDFSDRLSPMLVKELRQGMRSKLFVGVFLLLHVVLVLVVLPQLLEGGSSNSSEHFWMCVGLGLAVLLPLTGFNAIHEERSQNMLDTLVLTRLSSWRIVVGKWASIAARTLLLVVTLLPYLVLRYYGGGINLVDEVYYLAFICIVSLVTTAIVVANSGHRLMLLRGVFSLAAGGLSFALLVAMVEKIGRQGYAYASSGPMMDWLGKLTFVGFGSFLAYYFLETGAAMIAPAAENRISRRRVWSLVFMAILGVLMHVLDSHPALGGQVLQDKDACVILFWVVLLWISLEAMLEPIPELEVILEPFTRRGLLGGLAYIFIGPGWHSGVFFSLLLLGSFALATATIIPSSWLAAVWVLVAQTLYGVLLVRLFFKKPNHGMVAFWLIQAISLCLVGVLGAVAHNSDLKDLMLILLPVPTSSLVFMGSSANLVGETMGLYVMVYGVALFVLAANRFVKSRKPSSWKNLVEDAPEHPNAR